MSLFVDEFLWKFEREMASNITGVLIEQRIAHRPFISIFRSSIPGLVIGFLIQYFIIFGTFAPSGPLSCESTFHYLSFNWFLKKLTDLLNFLAFIMRCLYVKSLCSWGLLRPEHSGGIVSECVPLPSNYASLPCIEGPLVWYVRDCLIRSGVHWFVG